MTLREELVTLIADTIPTPYYSRKKHANAREIALERAEDVAVALLAHRDLLLEALGGWSFVLRGGNYPDEGGPVVWRFPVSEEVQT